MIELRPHGFSVQAETRNILAENASFPEEPCVLTADGAGESIYAERPEKQTLTRNRRLRFCAAVENSEEFV